MNHEELKQQYALDELLHPEGKPWEWWESAYSQDPGEWSSLIQSPTLHTDWLYRRKSTAPNWDQELSPKEVVECDELPMGYEVAVDDGYVAILYCGAEIWNENHGWLYEQKADNNILDHFKKRRQQALLEQEPTDEQLDKGADLIKEMTYNKLLQRIEALEKEINHKETEEKPFAPQVGSYWKDKETNWVFILCTPEYQRYALINMKDGRRWSTAADTLIGAFGVSGQVQLTQITKQEALELLA